MTTRYARPSAAPITYGHHYRTSWVCPAYGTPPMLDDLARLTVVVDLAVKDHA